MIKLLFSLFRKSAVQLFLLCPIMTPAAEAADRRAFEDFFSSYNRVCLPITCEHEAWCMKEAFAHAMLYVPMHEKGHRLHPLLYASARNAPASPSRPSFPQHGRNNTTSASSYRTSSWCGYVTGARSRSRLAESLTKTLPYVPPCRKSYEEGSSGKWCFIYWHVLNLFNSYTSCAHVAFILMLAVVKLW